MNIGIIGLGYVGLTLGIVMATKGITVYGIDINPDIKNSLESNKPPFYEKGLENLIKRVNHKGFYVVDKFPRNVFFDAFIIAVGTPLKYIDGHKQENPNFEYIKSAIKSLQEVYDGKQLIILRSTVSVGTTREFVIPYLTKFCKKTNQEILVSMCPERTLEGNAIYELTHLPQIISGNNEASLDIAEKIFRSITQCIIRAKSLEEAELVKLYCNTYRDITFALGNVFCMAAQEFGVDGISAINLANYGYARSNIAHPGFVAGPCLEKDAYILISKLPECESKKFILSARKFNESLEDLVVKWVRTKIGVSSNENTIALSGLVFKGQPETSDFRSSSSVYIAHKLKDIGYKINLHDFVANSQDIEKLQLGKVCATLQDALKDAKLLLILNNNKKYATLTKEDLFTDNQNSIEILDAWDICTKLHHCDKLKISTLGNMFNYLKV